MSNAKELTDDQKNDLLDNFNVALKKLVEHGEGSGVHALGFVSLCVRLDIPVSRYKASREADKAFALACEELERTFTDIIGDTAKASALTKGKPQDQLRMAERVDPVQFGEKEKPAMVALIFEQMQPKQLETEIEAMITIEGVCKKSSDLFSAPDVKGLLNG